MLFACTGNGARSPIAEALLRHRGAGHVQVTSAGSQPKSCVHPNAVRVLQEMFGIDVSAQRPLHLDAVTGSRFGYLISCYLISLCDKVREVCPELVPARLRLIHWSIPDPATSGDTDQASYPAFRRAAADIDMRIRHLLPVLARTT